jgi:acyl-CoA synthetase (AMP-forming)/AMP-acid ligase II
MTLAKQEPPMDICDLIREGARVRPDRPAVICDGETLTYAMLHERSCRLANALANLGIEPGERVATLGDNCPQTLEQMSGIALGAFVRSSLYTHNSADTNLYLLDLIEASALLVQGKHYDAIAPRLSEIASLRHVLVFDGDAPDGHDYELALQQASSELPATTMKPDDPYIIRFSAGTTGKPKGILHTLAGWVAIATETALAMPPQHESDRYLAAGPIAHAAALPVSPTLAAGGTIVVMRAFDPQRFIELVEQERCTTTMLVPTMIQMIASHPDADRSDLSSLRWMLYGAAPISEQTLARALAVWGPIMQQMYGQSEGVPLTVLSCEDHVLDGSEQAQRRLRSAGRPTPNTELLILDADGNGLPVGEVGEIAALTPTAMAGIWRDEQATSERILPSGALLTRDMGYIDEDGYLFLADRKEDMIISGGFNIWPAELENALASHPAVAEVAVVGVAHEKWGETPKAVIVLREGEHASEQELIDWTREKLGAIKRVTSVDFADELPKTPLGKVLRRVVRDRYVGTEDRLGRV